MTVKSSRSRLPTLEDFADMQTEIHVGYGLAARCLALFQFSDSLARSGRGRQRGAGCVPAVFSCEDSEGAVANQLEYITTMLVDR
jgi:hypothetical protein